MERIHPPRPEGGASRAVGVSGDVGGAIVKSNPARLSRPDAD